MTAAGIERVRPTAVAVALPAAALLLGGAVAVSPSVAILLIAAPVICITLAVLPLRFFPAIAMAGAVAVPSILLEAQVRGISINSTPLGGQGKLVLFVAAFCLARTVIMRRQVVLPRLSAIAVGVYVATVVFTVVVASFNGHFYAGLASDLFRQLSYVAAFPLGLIAAELCGSARDWARPLAFVTIGAALLSVLYFSWSVLGVNPPMLGSLFQHVASTSVYDRSRSIFPFVDDSPNVGSVAFVCIGAFLFPSLQLSSRPRDRLLSWFVLTSAAAAVLTTQSRTGLIVLAVATLPYLILIPNLKRRFWTAIGLAVVALFVLQGYRLFPQGRQISSSAQTLLVRESVWGQAYSAFRQSPAFGKGFRYSARDNFAEIDPVTTSGASGLHPRSVHNEYLGQIVDGGVIGGAFFLYFLSCVIRIGWRTTQRVRPAPSPEGLGFLCFLGTLLVAMTAMAAFPSAVVAIEIWLFFGITSGVFASRGIRAGATPTSALID